jgi:predicted DCC family thiol-disulfide oxidoreductase YuxK
MDKQPHRIVLFDGVCSVCDQAVLFIVDHDHRRCFSFAPIQSPIGERLLAAHGLSEGWGRNNEDTEIATRLFVAVVRHNSN